MIELKDVIYRCQTKDILHNISCHFVQGQSTALVGYNGAGKTSLVDVAIKRVPIHCGYILWQKGLTKKDIGLVPQRSVFLNRSVQKNIDYVKQAYGLDNPLSNSSEKNLLEQLHLEPFLHQQAVTLSEGEKKRLALFLALVHTPKILFLDEPYAYLDPENNDLIEAVIMQQKEKGLTLVMVSHQMSHIKKTCDKICFLHKGRIVENGDIQILLQQSKNPLTHRYYHGT